MIIKIDIQKCPTYCLYYTRWLMKDYYEVTDEKLFFLESVKHGFEFEIIDDPKFYWLLCKN